MNLKELLEQNPEAKKEYELQIKGLEQLGIALIREQANYISSLEEMIEENVCREEILQTIDFHNHYTERMQYEGLLEQDETWWEQVMERD